MKTKKSTPDHHHDAAAIARHRELVALMLIPGVGAYRINQLLEQVEQPRDIFRMSFRDLQAAYGIGPSTARAIRSFDNWRKADEILENTLRAGADIVTSLDADYPELLRQIYDPPAVLWLRGDRSVLDTDCVAVVGTRRAGRYGRRVAERFAGGLVRQNITVVSGLAYGIDTEAHRTAVRENGKTIAVLGSGIDRIYPSRNAGLARAIEESGGAVISEFPPGTRPEATNFPLRNRIVSGLSLGTLVVESGQEGGSIITVNSALDQNREVFVVPHRLGHPGGAGCNHLIKSGTGKLVQDIDDLLDEINVHRSSASAPVEKPAPAWLVRPLDPVSRSICMELQKTPLHIDELAERLESPPHQLLSNLLELEMQDCVCQIAGRRFAIAFAR